MLPGKLIELHTKAALAAFDCGCFALIEDYAKRAPFWHCRFDVHSVSGCDHSRCSSRHRCGTSGTDGRHANACGPRPGDRPDVPHVSPTPDIPPRQVAPAPRQVALPRRPTPRPAPVLDDGLDDSWAGLLDGATPALARR